MADLFAVLADPTRRRILDLVRKAEVSVNDIVAQVEIKQSGVSRHLKILEENGLVEKRADAQRRLYSVRAEPLQEIDSWLSGYRELWEDRLDRLARHLDEVQKN